MGDILYHICYLFEKYEFLEIHALNIASFIIYLEPDIVQGF